MIIICMIRYFFENSSNDNRKLVLSTIIKNNYDSMSSNFITGNIKIFEKLLKKIILKRGKRI